MCVAVGMVYCNPSSEETRDMTNLVPGKLWIFFLNAVLITVPTSLAVLGGYRRAVSRTMRLPDKKPAMQSADLRTDIQSHVRDSWQARNDPAAARRRLVAIYAGGSFVAAAIMAFLYAWSMQFDISARGLFVTWYVFAWPMVPISVVLLAWPQRWNVPLLLSYALAGVAVIACWTAAATVMGISTFSPLKNAAWALEFFAKQVWLPYSIILLTGNRRLKPVSPLVLAGLLVFSFATLFSRNLYIAAVETHPNAVWLQFPGSNTYSFWYLIAALPIGYACWLGIRLVARGFDRKRFSDVQLLVDSWWLIVAFQFSTELANEFGWGGTAGLLAFLGYRGVVEVGLHLTPLRHGQAGPTLLLLRVFGFQRRTEALFDSIAERWRFTGPVLLIAGADLAMRTLNPGDVISYLSGRLKSRFIADPAQIQQTLTTQDQRADPDGRFRTTKIFCREDTWRPTLSYLLDQGHVVLMDLRGFNPANQGCIFELEELTARELLSQTIFVIDDATDVTLLRGTVQEQATALGTSVAPSLHIQHVSRQSGAELESVFADLQTAAQRRIGAEESSRYTG
jgi:hypothetical protein